jgi:hypothetical protein
LESVDLSGFCENQSGLRSLDLSSTGVTDANLQQLSTMTSLQDFQVVCQPGRITDAGLRHLSGNHRLTALRIWESEVTGEFLDAFAESRLQTLSVTRSRRPEAIGGWTRAGSQTLIENVPKLLDLDLSQQFVSDDDLLPLMALQRLSVLSLSGCSNLTDGGIARLTTKLQRLQTLNLGDTAAGPAFARGVPRMYFLKTLRMESAGLTDDSIEQFSRSRSLRSLHLEADEPVGYSAAALAMLWRIPNLENLRIDATLRLGRDFEDFAAAPSIRELTVHADSLSEELIAILPRLETLERFNILRPEPQQLDFWSKKIFAVRPRLKVQNR